MRAKYDRYGLRFDGEGEHERPDDVGDHRAMANANVLRSALRSRRDVDDAGDHRHRLVAHDRLHLHHHAGRAADGARGAAEAARADGANGWRVLWNVTLPMMSPTIFFATVITSSARSRSSTRCRSSPQGGPDDSDLDDRDVPLPDRLPAFGSATPRRVAADVLVMMVVTLAAVPLLSRRWVHRRSPAGRRRLGAPVAGGCLTSSWCSPGADDRTAGLDGDRDALSGRADALRLPPQWIPRPLTLENFQQRARVDPVRPDGVEQPASIATITDGSDRCRRAHWPPTRSRGCGSPAADQIFLRLLAALMSRFS